MKASHQLLLQALVSRVPLCDGFLRVRNRHTASPVHPKIFLTVGLLGQMLGAMGSRGCALGLATLQRDGFAGYRAGTVVSVRVAVVGERLTLSLDGVATRQPGYMWVSWAIRIVLPRPCPDRFTLTLYFVACALSLPGRAAVSVVNMRGQVDLSALIKAGRKCHSGCRCARFCACTNKEPVE